MPFLFLCCGGSRSYKHADAEKETRRARIVPILDPSAYDHRAYYPDQQSLDFPPPRYDDVSGSVSLNTVPIVLVDEKDRNNTIQIAEVPSPTEPEETQAPAYLDVSNTGATPPQFEGSDRSSIVSIPSTQVTGLGSSYTGTTTLRGETTGRNSRDDGRLSETGTLHDNRSSRPPSYYASRSSSPGSDGSGDSVSQHIVMREDWFENLRGTRGSGDYQRRRTVAAPQ